MAHKTDDTCIFCKIIAGTIPSYKLHDSSHVYAFLDIGPLSSGHALVIPKYHAAKLHELPDEHLTQLLPVAKRIAVASGAEEYNLLQNNGRGAHQLVDHVHFHVIPKPDQEEGLKMEWEPKKMSQEELRVVFEKMKGKM